MAIKYVLENKNEAKRLEKQSTSKNFSLEEEFKNIVLPQSGKFLDAGCGSGVACNFINEILPNIDMHGCDLSTDRLEFAKKNVPQTNFFQADLTELSSLGQKYDCIINRYVAHHLPIDLYRMVLAEFKKSLKPDGKLVIIDAEGALLNIGTTNQQLHKMLATIKANFPGNLYMARYIPTLLKEVGYENISYEIETMDFQGQDKLDEIEQYRDRFENSKEFYIDCLGAENVFEKFIDLYFHELQNSTLFYNKFIIQA